MTLPIRKLSTSLTFFDIKAKYNKRTIGTTFTQVMLSVWLVIMSDAAGECKVECILYCKYKASSLKWGSMTATK